MNIILIVCAIALAFVTSAMAKKQLASNAQWQSAPGSIKALVWLTDLLNPIFGGLILYYSLRKQLPLIAKKSNTISFITFTIWIVVGMAYYFIIAQH